MKTEMKTMSEILLKLQNKGYTTNFGEMDGGIADMENKKKFQPNDLKIVKVYRFEGESDPDDMSVLYAIEAKNGAKGTFVEAYGPDANDDAYELTKFIKNIPQDIRETI